MSKYNYFKTWDIGQYIQKKADNVFIINVMTIAHHITLYKNIGLDVEIVSYQ